MSQDDEADRLRIKVKTKDGDRHQYKGNKNPSQHEFAAEGYETLVMASNDPYTRKDRPTLGEDVEDELRYVNRGVW